MSGITHVYEAIMQPDTQLATTFNAYIQNANNDEREKAAKALIGGPLFDEHDSSRKIGRIIDGYVQKEGKHKNAIVQVFEVTDPEYIRKIENGERRNVSMGIDVELFDSPLIQKGVKTIVFNEMSLVDVPGVTNAKIVTASKVRVSDGAILMQRVYASRKNNVTEPPTQKMSTPVNATASTPAVAPPAPSVPSVPTVPPTAPTAAPTAIPAAPTSPELVETKPELSEEDRKADAFLRFAQEQAKRATEMNMTLEQYQDFQARMFAAGQEAENKKREEEARMKQFVADQEKTSKQMYLRDRLAKAAMHEEAFNDLNKRTIDRTQNVEDLKEIETRFVENRMTPSDIEYLKEVVNLSEQVAVTASKQAPAAVPFDQFAKSIAEIQREGVKNALKNAKPVQQQKAADVEVSAKMTDGMTPVSTVSVNASASRKRVLPSMVRLTASAKTENVELNLSGYDVPQGMTAAITTDAPRTEEDRAARRQFIEDTGIFKRARVGMFDTSTAQVPQYTNQLYGDRLGVNASARNETRVQYGFADSMIQTLRSTPEGRKLQVLASKPGRPLSIIEQNNPALAFLADHYPDVLKVLNESDAPRVWTDAYSTRVQKMALAPELSEERRRVLASKHTEPEIWNQWMRYTNMGPNVFNRDVVEPMDI